MLDFTYVCGYEIKDEPIKKVQLSMPDNYPALQESDVGSTSSEQDDNETSNSSNLASFVCYNNRTALEGRREGDGSNTNVEANHCGDRGASFSCVAPPQRRIQDSTVALNCNRQFHYTEDLVNEEEEKLWQAVCDKETNLLEDAMFEILSPRNALEDDLAEDNQVLCPEIMEGMQSHFPLIKKGESFWLQYSLVRDGASMDALLYKTRNTQYSVLAIETVDGEIFGAFTSQRWQMHHDFFGSRESFLWRYNPRSDSDRGEYDEDLEFFHFSFLNDDVQLCTHDRIAVGGGIRKLDPEYGFGISLDSDLLTGTTNKCLTFMSPPLSKIHADGTTFEVRNLEVWALTPCLSLEDAERVQNKLIWA